MAKLPSLITNETTGEAINYYGSSHNENPFIKQTFEVTKNDNYTWTIKSSLYIKLPTTVTSGGFNMGTCCVFIGGQRFDVQEVQIMTTGVWTRGSKISNNPYEWTKILEGTMNYECTSSGRNAVRLYCGYLNPSGTTSYLFYDYTLIYVTLPSFSGLEYKINGSWKYVMPWIKVNGTWKRANQFMKINDEWKEYHDTWMWNPET